MSFINVGCQRYIQYTHGCFYILENYLFNLYVTVYYNDIFFINGEGNMFTAYLLTYLYKPRFTTIVVR